MMWGSSPGALAEPFQHAGAELGRGRRRAARAERARRSCSSGSRSKEPATLNQVAGAVGRGAPAVSRAVDALVRAGLVERTQDPDNRRRLALRLTSQGREALTNLPQAGSGLEMRLERLAHSELRAIERAIEILERA